jgi:iron complex transport system ATP-binding protein
MKPEPWSLRILGRDRWNLFELRNQLGLVSNDWMQMCTRDYSGYEIALSGFFGSVGVWPHHEVTPEMERKTREVMDLLEISHLAARNTNEMSSGEARRILIARALVHDPQALVLDEPTTSLDLRATCELRDVLRKLAANGISILMVTHHLPDIIPEMRRVVLIREGRVVMDGPKEQVLEAGALSGLFGIPVEVLERGGYYHVL